MKIVKLPLNFAECGQKEKEELFHQMFDDVFSFMKENRYAISGDVIGIKISMSLEDVRDTRVKFRALVEAQEKRAAMSAQVVEE